MKVKKSILLFILITIFIANSISVFYSQEITTKTSSETTIHIKTEQESPEALGEENIKAQLEKELISETQKEIIESIDFLKTTAIYFGVIALILIVLFILLIAYGYYVTIKWNNLINESEDVKNETNEKYKEVEGTTKQIKQINQKIKNINKMINGFMEKLGNQYLSEVPSEENEKKVSINKIDFYNLNNWIATGYKGDIVEEDGQKCIKIRYREGTNSSIHLFFGNFESGKTYKASVKFKTNPGNFGGIFLGDAGGSDPYDNWTQEFMEGNQFWQEIAVEINYEHNDVAMLYIYGSRNNGKKGDYVLYTDLKIETI